MGQAKREWEEDCERGWSAPEKTVCPDCVDEEFLKNLIRCNAVSTDCDYCGESTESPTAALVEVIMPAVSSALNYCFAEPSNAGVPYDGGWLVEPRLTADALQGIPFDCKEELLQDVACSFLNEAWVPAADGHWMSTHSNEELSWAWQAFAKRVKHQSRYFFLASNGSQDGSRGQPFDLLGSIGKIAGELGLLRTLPGGISFYRVRERVGNAGWLSCAEQLGAPPSAFANAGRMNPAGISYLYLSQSEKGALAEVLRGPPCQAVVAHFISARPLNVLDLTVLPAQPSIFDEGGRQVREAVLFLEAFVADICEPVKKDGLEHINYVPSQVVSEYFAQVYRTPGNKQLDGIRYPSAVAPGSVNLALFPKEAPVTYAAQVAFDSGREVSLDTWAEFAKAIF